MPDSTSHIDIAGDLRQAEGSGAATDFTFTVTRSDGAGAAAVDWWVWSDQTDAADFVGRTGGTVYFAEGETSKTLTVQAAGDSAAEADETFHVSLANARGAGLGADMASGTILDDDSGSTSPPTDPPPSGGGGSGAPALTISGGGQVAEGESATFTVTRSGSPVGEAAVDWWVWGQTDGADFTGATGGTVYFHDGETAKTITLASVADGQAEGDEAFHVSLANARGAALTADVADAVLSEAAPSSGSGSGGGGDGGSGDPPPASPTITVSGGGDVEEGHAATFTVTRSAAAGDAAVDWWVWGQTDGADFSGPTGGTVYFHDGETAKTLTLTAVADGAPEGREDFHLTLANARGATLAGDTASGGITEPTAPPPAPEPPPAEVHGAFRLSAPGSLFSEGAHLTLTVHRLYSTEGEADVDYRVVHIGTSDADFVGPISGTVHFAPSETSQTFDLIARADGIADPSERFEVQLSNARGAAIDQGTVAKSIYDRAVDFTVAPTVSISAGASINEGNSGGLTPFVFSIVRSNPSGEAAVDYYVDFSAFSWATVQPDDLASPLSGTLRFLDGETAKDLRMMVIADTIPEPNEVLTVALANPQEMTFGAFSRVQMSVLTDDLPPAPTTTFAMGGGPQTVDEGGELAVTVFRRGDISAAGSVSYAIGPGRPPNVYADSADFAGPTSGVVQFAPGQSGVVIHLQVLNDGVDEYDEAYHFYLYDPQGGALDGELQTSLNGFINDFVG